MPVTCTLISGKWRITAAGRIEVTANGKPRDGGGHESREECMAQARAINASLTQDKGTVDEQGVYKP